MPEKRSCQKSRKIAQPQIPAADPKTRVDPKIHHPRQEKQIPENGEFFSQRVEKIVEHPQHTP